MRLALATLADFDFCKELYGNCDYDMIYRKPLREEKSANAKNPSTENFLDGIIAMNSEMTTITKEQFEDQINKKYNRIFIIYDDSEDKIGYFSLTLIHPNTPRKRCSTVNRWKLEFMFLKNSSFENFKEAIFLLSKEKYMDIVEVAIVYDETIQLFMKIGFEKLDEGYLRKTNKRSE